jgi:hypothetical protein
MAGRPYDSVLAVSLLPKSEHEHMLQLYDRDSDCLLACQCFAYLPVLACLLLRFVLVVMLVACCCFSMNAYWQSTQRH